MRGEGGGAGVAGLWFEGGDATGSVNLSPPALTKNQVRDRPSAGLWAGKCLVSESSPLRLCPSAARCRQTGVSGPGRLGFSLAARRLSEPGPQVVTLPDRSGTVLCDGNLPTTPFPRLTVLR